MTVYSYSYSLWDSLIPWLLMCSCFQCMIIVFNTFVHTWNMHAVAIWDLHQQGLINSLESVQRFALKASTIGIGKSAMIYPYEYLQFTHSGRARHCMSEAVHSLPNIQRTYYYLNPFCSCWKKIVAKKSEKLLRTHAESRPAVHTNAHQYSFFPHTKPTPLNCAVMYLIKHF